MPESIQVGYRQVLPGIYHKFILYTNNSGTQFVSHAGPSIPLPDGAPPTTGQAGSLIPAAWLYDMMTGADPFGELTGSIEPFKGSWDDVSGATYHYEDIIRGDDLTNYWHD